MTVHSENIIQRDGADFNVRIKSIIDYFQKKIFIKAGVGDVRCGKKPTNSA